ncbi:MAG: hypothetical protein NC133_04450, partial [Prevotella sp.]|nr:hypothetical protein [Prevotella sp.]
WHVVYLSTTTDGRPILTLYLANAYATSYASEYWYSATHAFPWNMYGTSYLRAFLNNSGNYSSNGNDLVTYQPSADDALATVKALDNVLVTPSNVAWQASGQDARTLSFAINHASELGGPYRASNENYETESNDGWFSTSANLSTLVGYRNWIDDEIWIPSASEIETIWQLSTQQRSSSQNVWTRSAIHDKYSNCLYILNTEGGIDQRNLGIESILGVRPALHIDLSAKELCAHSEYVLDESYHNDTALYRCTHCGDSYYVENGNRNYLHEIAIGLTSAAYDTNLIIRIYNDSIDALDIRDVMDTICPDTPQFDEDGVLIYNPNNALIGCGGEVILNTDPTQKFNVLYAIGRRVASQGQFSILVYYDWFGTVENTSHYFIMRDDHIDNNVTCTDTVTQV